MNHKKSFIMFQLVSEAQEIKEGLYADVLKDENNNICLAIDSNFFDKFTVVKKIALVYLYEDNLRDAIRGLDNDDMGLVRDSSYKFFETYADYCKWYSYNVA